MSISIYTLTGRFYRANCECTTMEKEHTLVAFNVLCPGGNETNGISFGETPEQAIKLFIDLLHKEWVDYFVHSGNDYFSISLKDDSNHEWIGFFDIKAELISFEDAPETLRIALAINKEISADKLLQFVRIFAD